jgi:hypothetical protein
MRTVLVHLRSGTEKEITEFLSRTYPKQKGRPWICDVNGDACLYINVYRVPVEFEAERMSSLRKELGCDLRVSLSADVSGRHPGDEQVRDFVYRLLSEFGGLAEDDWTDGWWTLDEIMSERTRPSTLSGKRHTFFDHRYPWHTL